MKISIDIDCTPQEARAFFGMPNVEPVNEALMAQMQERLAHHLHAVDPDTLFKTWMAGGIKGLTELQEQFWSQMAKGGKSSKD